MAPFLFLRFHILKLWTYHPVALISAFCSVLAAVGVLAWYGFVSNQYSEGAATLAVLQTRRPIPAGEVPAMQRGVPQLPDFDGKDIVSQFEIAATDVSMPVDEVTYALESSADQPYRRYRINLAVETGYPQIRRFVAALASRLPHVSLDGIRCAREKPAATSLRCELAFSAFFRKADHG